MITKETTLYRSLNDTDSNKYRSPLHHTAFNNGKIPYFIVSYKRSEMTNVLQFKHENFIY